MKKKNLVMFCTDQQRANSLSCMGNTAISTPNIDRLAEEGTVFTRAYCQSPVCTPSRVSFMTGRYPCVTKGFYNGNGSYSKDEVLFTKTLADNGYTCANVGKLHLSAAKNRMEWRGDDGYSVMKWSHTPYNEWEDGINKYQTWLKENGYDWEKEYGINGEVADLKGSKAYVDGIRPELHQTTWCVSEAIDFIDKSKNCDGSWAVTINTFDPHPPFDPPREYKDKIKVEDMPLPLWKDGEMDNKPSHQQTDIIQGGQDGLAESIMELSDMQKRERIRDYYAEILLIDDQVGRLLRYLDENNLREDTIVIFMSDHGEMLGDHGLYWKGAYFYEALTHIPLIMSCPGTIKEGQKCTGLVELVDLAPTICELCTGTVPNQMQGVSFARILTGEADPTHFKDSVYCEFYRCLGRAHKDTFATMYFDGRYKVVCYHNTDEGELYDLEKDPDEYDNLWSNPEYENLKNEMVRKNFNSSIIRTRDFSMQRISIY